VGLRGVSRRERAKACAPAITVRLEGGELQQLFDQRDMAAITSLDYPDG
jgi:hypothetical protein